MNGPTGLALIPKPLSSIVALSQVGYQWLYVGIAGVTSLGVFLVVQALTNSPLGRAMPR